MELTGMLRCAETHAEGFVVLSTGEMLGRMVRSGIAGCSICHREYVIKDGVVDFGGGMGTGDRTMVAPFPIPHSPIPDPPTLQALLDLSGPGGYVGPVGTPAGPST